MLLFGPISLQIEMNNKGVHVSSGAKAHAPVVGSRVGACVGDRVCDRVGDRVDSDEFVTPSTAIDMLDRSRRCGISALTVTGNCQGHEGCTARSWVVLFETVQPAERNCASST